MISDRRATKLLVISGGSPLIRDQPGYVVRSVAEMVGDTVVRNTVVQVGIAPDVVGQVRNTVVDNIIDLHRVL